MKVKCLRVWSEGWSPHKYPGISQLVDGDIWDVEAGSSSLSTWTIKTVTANLFWNRILIYKTNFPSCKLVDFLF